MDRLTYHYNDNDYKVIVKKKNNKNTYLKVNSNLEILITTHYFTLNCDINKLLFDNQKQINKMIDKQIKKREKEIDFYLFGKKYDIIYGNLFDKIDVTDNRIFVKDKEKFNKYLNNIIKETFVNHLRNNYLLFTENISYPTLRIRKMKTRWGVCNYKTKTITLNYNLYMYDIKCLDYVIIHELAHLVYPNHSKDFWNVVSKYEPNYKQIKRILKE